ncbi:hypothetical protein [Streptomyces sp. NPDC058011]|uniref:hypothetical protein n=1 Tax=Streptomyces sp. NPDC058011 TaxID=3346305 RepID=UPI0036E5ACCD
MRAPGRRGERGGEAEQRGRVGRPRPVRAAADDLADQPLAVHREAQEPAGVHPGAARSFRRAQRSAAQAEPEREARQECAGEGHGNPRSSAERPFGDPEQPCGGEAGGAGQQREQRPPGARLGVGTGRWRCGR